MRRMHGAKFLPVFGNSRRQAVPAASGRPLVAMAAQVRVECTPGACPCGVLCGNQRMQRQQHAATRCGPFAAVEAGI